MPVLTSHYKAPQIFVDYEQIDNGKAPSVPIKPGENEVTNAELKILKNIKAFNDAVKSGVIDLPTKVKKESAEGDE